MKKQTCAAALVSTLLISALAGTLFVNVGTANFIPSPEDISVFITVDSPSPRNDGIYNSTSVPLQFAVCMYLERWTGLYRKILSVQYRVDGVWSGELVDGDVLLGRVTFSFILTGLSEGRHYVEVTAMGSLAGIQKSASSGKIIFGVDTVPPRVQFVEQAFGSNDVSFNFTVNEAASWLGYSLNGKSVITVTDSVASTGSFGTCNYQLTLNGLPDGSHNLAVYAKDLAGNMGESEAVNFTVGQETQPETEQTASESSPTALVVGASGVFLAVAGLGLLFFFKKKERTS